MPQYMLSVHTAPATDGEAPEPMTDEQMLHSMAQINALEAEMTAADALVLERTPDRGGHRHRRADVRGRGADH
jgi:hypothetical protein